MLLFGGTCQLIFVADESIDILERHHRLEDDEESYNEACETLETDYGLCFSQLIGVFASQGYLIFVPRDRTDSLIYGYDVAQWELMILGEGWEEALKTFSEWISGGNGCAFISATRENRVKCRAGWRPPPFSDRLLYQ